MSYDQWIQQKGSFHPDGKSSIPVFLHMKMADLVPTKLLSCASARNQTDLNHQQKIGKEAITSAWRIHRDSAHYAPGNPVLARPTVRNLATWTGGWTGVPFAGSL